MSSQNKTGRHGLPWPAAYESMRPQIEQQWEIDGEIYLNRVLNGGKSGALVYAADVTSRDFTGQAILKFDRAPDPTRQEWNEAERHNRAFQVAPDYAAQHLPKVLHTLHHGDNIAILSSIAGRGLEYAVPWSDLEHEPALDVVHRLSRELLEDWNHDHEMSPGMLSPKELLQNWLTYRLDPKQGRIHGFLNEHCALSQEDTSFVFEGQWYPNPLCFATSRSNLTDNLQLRAVRGNVHGDLHGHNVLVVNAANSEPQYYLIDLALFRQEQYLFYDHAYFEVSYLLASREHAHGAHWEALLAYLSPFQHRGRTEIPYSDDLGLVTLVKSLRREVLNWVDRHQANRLAYMESQYLLARVAAGMNFVNKPISEKARRLAFLYAAANLKDYLRLNRSDWPKHGPPFKIDVSIGSPGEAANLTPSGAAALFGDAHPALTENPAIAVLAFENLSGDSEQEYFVDGVAQEIITELSRIDWLMVISRGSSFTYKGQPVDAKRVGRELGVHYVVDGSVRKVGKRVRVSVQLTDAQSGLHVWAERFDRDLGDIFALQEEIAEAIAANIDSKLKVVEQVRARRQHNHSSVWESFQKGMWHIYRYTEEDAEAARQHLTKLTEQVPTFAAAYAALAILETRHVIFGDVETPDDLLEKASKDANKAVSLDEGNSMARIALSRVLAIQGSYEKAIEEAEMAVALNPSSSSAYLSLTMTLCYAGRMEEALAAVNNSIRLSPRGPFLVFKMFAKAAILYFLDQYSEAEELVRHAIRLAKRGIFSKLTLAAVLVRQGRLEEANDAIATALLVRPDMTISLLQASWRKFAPDYMEKFLGDLRKAGLPE